MRYAGGARLGPYEILSPLASGGMGEVYRARDTRLGREVAVKVLPASFAGDRERLHRFEQEARAASALNHPHILTVHDVGVHEGAPYLVTELLEGESLRQALQDGPLPLATAARYAIQITRGLAAAHGKGIIHRDLKPENIFVTGDGVKILDFGLAKLSGTSAPLEGAEAPTLAATRAGAVMGTVGYMSPEQARGTRVDQRTDLFSLGAVVYEMIGGRRAFPGASLADILSATLGSDPARLSDIRPGLPRSLEDAVRRCLAKDPDDRPRSAEELLSALEGQGPDRPPRRHALAWLASAAAIVGVAAVVMLSRSPPPPRAPDALAVLPFANLSGDPDQDYMADGMTDGLILGLAQIGSLRTMSRTSVMRFKGTAEPLESIAKTLRVDTLVEGSLAPSGDAWRINVKLVRAADGETLWANAYEGQAGGLPAIQGRIALAIANRVGAKLGRDESRRLAVPRDVDRRAYEAYLRGRFAMERGGPEDLRQAFEQFERAIGFDPAYAPPYVGMASYYALLPFYSDIPPADTLSKARDLVETALDLDQDLAEAHTVLAYIRAYYEWDWRAAEREFQRALSLRPSYGDAYFSYSRFLASRGRIAEAVEQIDRARALDPGELSLRANRALLLYFDRRYDEALAELDATLAVDPEMRLAEWGKGLVLEQKGRFDEAIGILTAGNASGNLNRRSSLGHACAVAGRSREARAILDELQTRSLSSYVPSYYFALVHAGLGDADQALHWLDKSYEERSTLLAYLRVDPRFDPLRTDPRFQALLDRL